VASREAVKDKGDGERGYENSQLFNLHPGVRKSSPKGQEPDKQVVGKNTRGHLVVVTGFSIAASGGKGGGNWCWGGGGGGGGVGGGLPKQLWSTPFVC